MNFSKSVAFSLTESLNIVAISSTDFRIKKKVLETHVILQF